MNAIILIIVIRLIFIIPAALLLANWLALALALALPLF